MKRFRKRTLLLLTALALVVPALVLSLVSIKVVRDFADILSSVRQEYGDYMAGIAAAALEDALLDGEQVNMVAARFVPPESPEEVVRFLNRLQQENPLYSLSFFVLPGGLVFYSDITPGRTTPYRPLPPWVVDTIVASMLKQGNVPSGLEHLHQGDPDHPLQLTFFTVHSVEGGLLGTAGFLWDLEQVQASQDFLERTMTRRLGEEKNLFRGAFFEAPTTITLLDQSGEPVFTTTPGPQDGYLSTRSLERVLPFYAIGIQLRGDRFDEWIQTVVRSSLAMIAALFAVIVLTLILALRYVLREIELAELKSALVSNVSHELKTPLALIRLFSETLELGRAGSKEKEKEFLRIINKESERLTHLINNVLDVSRIEQGRKSYSLAPVDLSVIVRETLDAYRYSLKQQGFTVESSIAEGLPPVSADADAMTQAVINLMENAIKYSGDRRYIGISLEQDREYAVISVRDRGVGIPPGDRDRIFEQFYRVERGLVHNVKGSGLGLSMVKHIVDAHGGRIEVESRLHEGSKFSILIPLHPPRDGASGPASTDGGPANGQASGGKA